MTPTTRVAVIGGGAAGLMAALWAARAGAAAAGGVVLLEGSRQCGLKILVSGGGRCNVLPSEFDLSDFYTSGSRNVLKRLFRTWSLGDVTSFFERDLGVPLVIEPDTGKVFPRAQDARVVRNALGDRARAEGATIQTGWRVASIEAEGERFLVQSESGASILADTVILATGGLSLPKTGSTGAGYDFARAFGHSIVPTYPALVPLTSPEPRWRDLSGIALPVTWRAVRDGKVLEERTRELLFTHRGFSGPAILDASHWFTREGVGLEIDWGVGEERLRTALAESGARDATSVVAQWLPRRLAKWLVERAGRAERSGILERAVAQLTKGERQGLVHELTRCPIELHGSVGYRVAEVTGGGVPLSEVQPSTLESRQRPGLYLCGEILDVIGRIGGYNFLWAWITGRLAGESAARSAGE